MGEARKRHGGSFKAQVVVAALRGDRTMAELSSESRVHPVVIGKWKKQVLEAIPGIMGGKSDSKSKNDEQLKSSLYQEIGQLKVELDWLKKKSGFER
jgi:putative transposase